jgi:hypothetical protein
MRPKRPQSRLESTLLGFTSLEKVSTNVRNVWGTGWIWTISRRVMTLRSEILLLISADKSCGWLHFEASRKSAADRLLDCNWKSLFHLGAAKLPVFLIANKSSIDHHPRKNPLPKVYELLILHLVGLFLLFL